MHGFGNYQPEPKQASTTVAPGLDKSVAQKTMSLEDRLRTDEVFKNLKQQYDQKEQDGWDCQDRGSMECFEAVQKDRDRLRALMNKRREHVANEN